MITVAATCREHICAIGWKIIAVSIKDLVTGKQVWLQTIWDQGHIGPSHYPLETSELRGFGELVQRVWTNIVKEGPTQQTEQSSKIMTIKQRTQWLARAKVKDTEGSPQ